MKTALSKITAGLRDAITLVYGRDFDPNELHTATQELLELRDTTADFSVGYLDGRLNAPREPSPFCVAEGYEAGYAEGARRRQLGAH